MGSRGPQPKSAAKRQRQNRQTGLVVQERLPEIPKPPRGLVKEVRGQWEQYWRSDISAIVDRAHMPAVRRLFQRYDERARAYKQVRKFGRLVKGSQGQPVKNPLLGYIDDCDKQIMALEDRLGCSPRGMLQLGNTFADLKKSLDDVNNRQLDVDDDEDPRL